MPRKRMDSIGNTQWVVPVDQGTEASISTLGEGSQTRATWGSVETAQRSGSSATVSVEDSPREGGTASARECTSVILGTKVEDIRVEAFPRSGFKSRRSQRQSFEVGTGLKAMGARVQRWMAFEQHARKPESSQRECLWINRSRMESSS